MSTSRLDRLLHLLLPAPCLGCGTPLPARRCPLGLCAACHGRLVRLPADACARCGRPLDAADLPAGYACGTCRRRPLACDRLLAVWSYEPPFDQVVLGLKFRRLDYLGSHLGELLAEAVAPALEGAHDAVVPVPLHWRRRLGRGYDQAEEIARALADRLGLPLRRLLSRHRATPPQSSLDRTHRAANLRRAFACRRPARVAGRRLLLVDDVVTTGATLEAAAACLKRAGARRVTALAAARTPRAGERRGPPGTLLPDPT